MQSAYLIFDLAKVLLFNSPFATDNLPKLNFREVL